MSSAHGIDSMKHMLNCWHAYQPSIGLLTNHTRWRVLHESLCSMYKFIWIFEHNRFVLHCKYFVSLEIEMRAKKSNEIGSIICQINIDNLNVVVIIFSYWIFTIQRKYNESRLPFTPKPNDSFQSIRLNDLCSRIVQFVICSSRREQFLLNFDKKLW